MQHATTDAGLDVVHYVQEAWARDLVPSMLLLDVSQFYPWINHEVMVAMLRKEGFAEDLVLFFADYLKGRFTRYLFNGKLTAPATTPVGMGQGSAFSPVGSGLYIAPLHQQKGKILPRPYRRRRPNTRLSRSGRPC